MPELRAFAICPTCSELYPASRGCPSCREAPVVAAAPEPAPHDAPQHPVAREVARRQASRRNLVPALALLGAGVVVGAGVLMALVS